MFYYLEQEFTLTTICTYENFPNEVELNLADLEFLIRDLKKVELNILVLSD